MTYQDFRDQVLSSIRGVGTNIAPDADWATIAFLGRTSINTVFLPDYARNDESKRKHNRVDIPRLIKRERPRFFGFVMTAWHLNLEDPQISDEMREIYERGAVRASESPYRQEIVLVTFATATFGEVWIAPIARRPDQAPALGTFSKPSTEVRSDLMSRAQEALRSLRKS